MLPPPLTVLPVDAFPHLPSRLDSWSSHSAVQDSELFLSWVGGLLSLEWGGIAQQQHVAVLTWSVLCSGHALCVIGCSADTCAKAQSHLVMFCENLGQGIFDWDL